MTRTRQAIGVFSGAAIGTVAWHAIEFVDRLLASPLLGWLHFPIIRNVSGLWYRPGRLTVIELPVDTLVKLALAIICALWFMERMGFDFRKSPPRCRACRGVLRDLICPSCPHCGEVI